MTFYKSIGRAVLGAAVVTGLAGCDISAPVGNPNTVPAPTIDQLFTTAQINSFFYTQTESARLATIWIQQLEGADRQFTTLHRYIITEEDGTGVWRSTYRQGGLLEIRQAAALAAEANRAAYVGVLQIHEAYLLGMTAGVYGAIPVDEAVDPTISEPNLVPQAQVYAHVQSLLDQAISNLQTGQGAPGVVDMNFAGNVNRWIAVANSLKARFHLHMAEVEPGRYAQALTAAQNGISENAGNWLARHTSTATENNLWYQFQRDRSGYIVPNPNFVQLLDQRNDPRLEVYFESFVTGAGGAIETAERIALPATPTFNQPIVTCAETQFIIAEAAYQTGDMARAQQALAAGIACQSAFWGVSITVPTGLTGAALLQEIMMQKYIANFLNPEIWNDWKRTCIPNVVPTNPDRQVPARLFYPNDERVANSNIPEASQQPTRNANDPVTPGCLGQQS
jgi:starch-binding outer membrane protein, SusD/RagB family